MTVKTDIAGPSIIDRDEVDRRWEELRRNPKCALALDPASVARFLSAKPESALVVEKIQEALDDLARLRLTAGQFENDVPKGSGDVVTCEGLDSFLVPAVENALSFSQTLGSIQGADGFADAFVKDVEGLLGLWEKGSFPGAPYVYGDAIRRCMKPAAKEQKEFAEINITESAAWACRVLVHLLELMLNRKENEKLFNEKIGARLAVPRLLNALGKAISVLASGIQRHPTAGIGGATAGEYGAPGTGWSWTTWQGLPPMLFFTAAAVDAFAELDLYLVRPAQPGARGLDSLLVDFYKQNRAAIHDFQFGVEMARRWIVSSVLPAISGGLGFYREPKVVLKLGSVTGADGSARSQEVTDGDRPPVLLYNNLYALLICLWTFADWSDEGDREDARTRAKVERALLQLIYNFRTLPGVKATLLESAFEFYLPDRDPDPAGRDRTVFDPGKKLDGREYLDSAFLQLLTRQLVLYGVYGVGDRNVMDPLIRDLYVELLFNRHREDIEYSAIWSASHRQVFATHRAIQSLTFYHAYALGREAAGGSTIAAAQRALLATLERVVEDLRGNRAADPSAALSQTSASAPNVADAPPARLEPPSSIRDCKSFINYVRNSGRDIPKVGDIEKLFTGEVQRIGQAILDSLREDTYGPAVHALLDRCRDLMAEPLDGEGNSRQKDLEGIQAAAAKAGVNTSGK